MFALAAIATTLYIQKTISQQGVVTGILYAMEESSTVIDNQVIRKGDTIYGVRVVSIEKVFVEFEKNGLRWQQRVREKPNPAWEDP